MSKTPTSCKDFNDNISQGGRIKEKTVELLYKQYFSAVVGNLHKKWSALGKDDILDAYTDAVLALAKTMERGDFKIDRDSACYAFLYSVAGRRCYDSWRKIKNMQTVDREPEDSDFDYDSAFDDYDFEILAWASKQLNETCQKVLRDWSHGYNMDEIAERNGLSNANSAAVTRKKCMDKLIKIIDDLGSRDNF